MQVVHGDREHDPIAGVASQCVDACTAYQAPPDITRAAVSAVRAFGPDVVHVQSGNNFALEAALRAGYPATKSLHVFDYCPSNTKYHHALDRACVHPTSRLCLPRMAYKRCTTSKRPSVWLAMMRRAEESNANNAAYRRIIVASDYVRRHALATGYAADRVTVVPYFVEMAAGAAPPPASRVILAPGRIIREKGFDLLIDALAHVPRPWRLVIAGDGMDRASIEQYARRAGVHDDIEFAGWQDEAGMDALYARASLVVVPSRWPEPSGIVGLEAMAHERPVAAFAVGGIPEWLDDGVTGRLVPPLDTRALGAAMTELLGDPAKAARMAAAGRARVAREFSAAGHVEQLLSVYAALAPAAA